MDDVCLVLESEQNCDAEFELKDLHFVNADVKLIKCVVENIVVDISFNQIGGVSTFCFLELVDRQVGKNHLFKRSIMLIKAWCYHESRILGAHHGLISTYALETLVLYIFNLFHKSMHGPLEVLYRFLEYFSKFEWDKYGISLNGPVDLSSLPNLSVEPTATQDELLLGKEFLQGPLDRLVVIPNGSDGCDTNFRLKHLNIIDPLKGNNNLGRSVSKANFYRIRSAFSFGAQKLGQILMLPSEIIPREICGFFENTLKRHGKGERPDLGRSSFQSLLGLEANASSEESSLKMSCMNEGENRSSCHSSKLPDKELKVADIHNRFLPGNVHDLPWNKIWFMEFASDFRANSSYLASFRSNSSFSQENEKESLPQFSQSDMLDLSGNLDLHLECLRKVQYHLEHLLDELLQAVQEACLAGVLDEDSFEIPTASFVTSSQSQLASSTDTERRKLSPIYCSHSTGDVSQQSHAEDQVDVIWQQNVPLSSNGLSLSSSPVTKSDNYLVSWFCVSPNSHGTGTYIPKMSYGMYKERMTAERRFMPRKQRQRLPVQQHYSLEQGCSGSRNEHATFQSATNQLQMKQKSSRQDVYSSKSVVPKGGFPAFREQLATWCGTNQVATNLSKVQSSQDISSSLAIDNSSKESVEKGRQTKPPSSGIVLPHHGQGNSSVSNTCQPSSPATEGYRQLKAQVGEKVELGSMGPFSLGLLSAQFQEAFPPLPTSKKPAEVPASTVKSPEPFDTQSRPQEVYQLRDEADFPPLQAGCR
ncbi:uncharacterized protein LOC133891091 [Phragmites australis]|uniref:uncharacterized protein LOC133891091 n=1 Tax=Phragmites australis TaxID=29695 RepID=UPI002D798719|nr:uncharacterized protein LOC133891091 [Phragmites australis]